MAARADGASDTEIFAAARQQLIAIIPTLLRQGSATLLLEYLALVAAQLEAVSVLGQEACLPYLDGRLDARLLPPGLVQRELDLTHRLILEPPRTAGRAITESEMEPLYEAVLTGMTPAHLNTLAGDRDHPLHCEAMMEFFRRIATLPEHQRLMMARYSFTL